ncbi:MAG: LPD38 domain-containing protein, partial [Methylobacter sp.]|nr:LPD38 domain-containing protein [Methylobacter sp.]
KFYSGWTDAAMATGKFKVISRDEALKISSGAGDAKGFYDPAAGGDTSYFVYNNISQDASAKELSGLVAHEVAVHALRLGKDDPDFKKLLKQFATMRKVNPAVRAAFARVPKDTKRKHILEEGLAYYLEGSGLNQSFKQKFVAAFRKMLRAIGKMMPVMQRTKWIRWANTLSEGDIITMANDALRAAPTSLQFDNAGRQGDSISLAKEQGYLLASAPQQRFYSALRKAFRDAPDKIFGNPTQVKLWLNSNAAKFDVKKDEIYWSGVNDWLDTLTGKVSKDEVLTFLDQNGVKVEDVALGEGYKGLPKEEGDRHNYLINKPSGYWSDEESGYIEAEPLTESEEKELNELQEKIQKGIAENKKAKHNTSQLTLPGGTDYRELVITILTIEKYNESDETHFGDVGNGRQIAWVRMNSRTDANGNTTQFLEEVQSQRGAKGRREGFSAGKRLTELPSNYKAIKEYDTWNVVDENGDEYAPFSATKERAIIEALDRINNNFNKVPPAPFVTDSNNKATNAYISLVMKKAISAAIDAGHDSVSWTTATQQADRYDLSKQISSVEYIPDTKTLRAFDLGGKSVIDQVTKPDQVQDYVGKEVAQRLFDSEPVLTGSGKQIHRVAGGDLKIGGAWTQAMYGDENGLNAQGQPALITQTAGAIAKKFGGKMGSIKLDIGTQPALIITPEMKAKILNEGMPLFSMRNTKASDTIEWSGTAHEYTDLKVKPGMRNEKLEAMVAQYVGVDGKPSRKELQEAVWQYREIEAEYFNKDGSQKKGAMLAPNGEKTTLNKSQWIMTRTDNFEKWFGDSQAIDENGDPRIFYHGTNADFNTFDSNKSFRKGKLFFTTDKDLAEQYGDKTLHVFLKANRIKTVTTSGQFIDALDNFTISDTFDGIEYIDTSELGNAIHQIVVFKPSQIKSTGNTGTFNPESSDIRFSKSGGNDWKDQAGFDGLSDEVLATLGKIGRPPGQGIIEKAKSQLEKHRYLWRNKLKQGMFDQFDSFKSILNDNRSWMMANISNTGGAVVESALEFGTPFMDKSGAIDINTGAKSLGQILEPLGDEVDRFLMWIAGNRAEGLKLDGKENLFSDGDIKNLKSLAGGNKTGKPRAIIYNAVRRDFEAMHDAFVKIGVDTGLVNAEEAALWKEQGFYIPFYRLAEEDENAHQGPSGIGGLVKQQAYKKLKGADMQLNDLLGNTVMNWNHLVNAGLKNQAAAKALESAKEMGLAKNIPAALKGKRSVYVRRDGLEHWYDLGESQEAQLVLDSLTALNWQGLNNFAMKVMRTFKRALTVGVTASPEFKIANLLRDSIQAIAVSDMDTNIAKNMYNGFKYSENGSVTKARMIAGGGAFGDSGYIHGGDPDAIKLVLEKSAKRANILDSRHAIKRMWDAYQDFGARLENVNRMANFEQALAQGKDLLTANFEARDQLDFQRTGSFTTIRALTQVIPFLGARMQGLDKLARSMADPKQRKQFIAVAGTYAMLSVLLFLAMKDDDDYKNAEQWERDSYHLFKLPGSDVMYRIPRPFEVGAIATMIERGVEQMVDDKVHGELFAERLKFALMNTLSIDIVPQALKPINEIWANKSTFTGRYIESQSMQNLSTTERKKAWTSQTAIGLSKAMDAILWDQVVLSPVQIEHLVNGYLGWAGATTLAGIDQIARPLVGAPAQPAMRLEDYPVIGRFMREGDGRNSRFITEFYDKQKELSQQFADIKQYRDNKEFDKYQEAMSEHKDDQRQRTYFNHVNKQITGLNNKIKLITANPSLSSEVKRDQIDLLNQRRIRLAKSAVDRIN